MVAELIPIPTKSSGDRPPINRPPFTGFSSDPDDRDGDMLRYLTDNVERLLRAAREVDSSIPIYLGLLEQRRQWILGEMAAEALLELPTHGPLGLEDDYNLPSLNWHLQSERARQYQRLLDIVDQARDLLQAKWWDQMWSADTSS